MAERRDSDSGKEGKIVGLEIEKLWDCRIGFSSLSDSMECA